MAAGLIASLIPLLEGSAAGVAAKGTMDMNKKKEGEKAILDDGLLSKSDTKVKGGESPFKTLSRDEKDELMIDLVMSGLTTKEAMNVIKTGYISKGDLEKIPVPLRRKISRMTGQDLGVQIGVGGPGDDKDPKKKEQKEKLDKLREDAKEQQREWERQETEFQKNDPKVKRRIEAKKSFEKAKAETPSQMERNDPLLKENSPTQKMKQGERLMKEAIKDGRVQEWEYNHVIPNSNIPVRP